MLIGNYQKLLVRIIKIKQKYYYQKPSSSQHCLKKSKIKMNYKKSFNIFFKLLENSFKNI